MSNKDDSQDVRIATVGQVELRVQKGWRCALVTFLRALRRLLPEQGTRSSPERLGKLSAKLCFSLSNCLMADFPVGYFVILN